MKNVLSLWRQSGGLALGLLGAVLVPALGVAAVTIFLTPHLEEIRTLGVTLFIPFVAAAGIAVGMALAPTHLTSLLSGYLFGTLAGMAGAMIVVALGTIVGYRTARRLAPGQARALLKASRWGNLLLAEMIDASPQKAALTAALARLPPQIPFAVGNLLAASAGLPILPLLAGTLTGMFPRVALVAVLGSQWATWQPGAPVPLGLTGAIAATVLGFGALAVWAAVILRRHSRSRAT